MGDISKNFSRSEYACKCGCGFNAVDKELVEVDQSIRDYFGARVTITSGCRCRDYNEEVQFDYVPNYIAYSSRSRHMKATASDKVVEGVPPIDVYRFLLSEYRDKDYGIGIYDWGIHVDVGYKKRRWDKRTNK